MLRFLRFAGETVFLHYEELEKMAATLVLVLTLTTGVSRLSSKCVLLNGH